MKVTPTAHVCLFLLGASPGVELKWAVGIGALNYKCDKELLVVENTNSPKPSIIFVLPQLLYPEETLVTTGSAFSRPWTFWRSCLASRSSSQDPGVREAWIG